MTEKTRRGGQASRYHHGDLRAALIASARDVLETAGVEGLSLRAVAKQAGVSQAAPYHHFADKAALLGAVAAQCVEELNRSLSAAADRALGPRERLHELGVAYVMHAASNPEMFALAQGAAFLDHQAPAELREARATTFAMLHDAVAQCLPAAGEDELRDAFAAAWSLVHGMAGLAIDGRLAAVLPAGDLESTARRLVRYLTLAPDPKD